MSTLRVTLTLRDGPVTLDARPTGVPGLVMHEQIVRVTPGGVQFNKAVREVTHLASSTSIHSREVLLPEQWNVLKNRVLQACAHLDWTLGVAEVTADPAYDLAAWRLSPGRLPADGPWAPLLETLEQWEAARRLDDACRNSDRLQSQLKLFLREQAFIRADAAHDPVTVTVAALIAEVAAEVQVNDPDVLARAHDSHLFHFVHPVLTPRFDLLQFTQFRDFTRPEWNALTLLTDTLLETAGAVLRGADGDEGSRPCLSEDLISFNGAVPERYEAFRLARARPRHLPHSRSVSQQWLKTRGHPYGNVAATVLALAETLAPGALHLDGPVVRWQAARETAARLAAQDRLPTLPTDVRPAAIVQPLTERGPAVQPPLF